MIWKFIKTKTGKVSFALCEKSGKLISEFDDVNLAYVTEKNTDKEIEGKTIRDYMSHHKKRIEARWTEGKITPDEWQYTNSSEFRSEQ